MCERLPSKKGNIQGELSAGRAVIQAPVTSAVTLAGPDEECSYEEMFVYIQPAPWKAAMVVEHSLKTSGCDEMPFV